MAPVLSSILPRLLAALGFLLMAGTGAHAAPPTQDPNLDKLWVYVGTYTDGSSKGIYRFDLDLVSGKLTGGELVGESTHPSFLAIHPNRRFLYSVSEVADSNGKPGGAISAFTIDPKSGKLTLLNQQSSHGAGPCHLVVERHGRQVLAANYGSGSICVLPIGADGRLGEATSFVQHHGSSVNPERQEAPHAHSINLDAAGRFAFVADLGLDQVLVYRFDSAHGTLTRNDPPSIKLASGAGPRHFAFHPNGRFAYVINEIHSTLTAMEYDADRGTLKERQTVSTLPRGFTGNNSTAEVLVHPSGKFVYGSNRGHNSIAIFAVDSSSGRLRLVGHQSHHIKTPRSFNIDPTGRYLLVANQDGASIVVFRIDMNTGALTPTGNEGPVPTPVCIKMIPAPG
jgi:6-phosphogluconolactonase